MNNKLTFTNGDISDNYASILMAHDLPNKSTILLEHKDFELIVEDCVSIGTPSGKTLTGTAILTLVTNGICSKSELIAFLSGECINCLSEYEFENCAWFEWRSKSGNWSSNTFDKIFESKEKNIELLNSFLKGE